MDLEVQNTVETHSEEAPCLLDPGPRAADNIRAVHCVILHFRRARPSTLPQQALYSSSILVKITTRSPCLPPPCPVHSLPSRSKNQREAKCVHSFPPAALLPGRGTLAGSKRPLLQDRVWQRSFTPVSLSPSLSLSLSQH